MEYINMVIQLGCQELTGPQIPEKKKKKKIGQFVLSVSSWI